MVRNFPSAASRPTGSVRHRGGLDQGCEAALGIALLSRWFGIGRPAVGRGRPDTPKLRSAGSHLSRCQGALRQTGRAPSVPRNCIRPCDHRPFSGGASGHRTSRAGSRRAVRTLGTVVLSGVRGFQPLAVGEGSQPLLGQPLRGRGSCSEQPSRCGTTTVFPRGTMRHDGLQRCA